MINKNFALAVLLLSALLTPPAAGTARSDEIPKKSIFISPELSGSAFVTDKGSLSAEENQDFNTDVHTGGYNFLLLPALTAGYWKSPWSIAVRYAYPVQFADLNLRYGRTAEGIIRGTELGLEFAYDFKEDTSRRFYGFSSISMRLSGEAELDVFDHGEKLYSPVFEPDRKMRNFTILAGVGYDLKTADNFSYGFRAALMYSSLDLSAPPVESDALAIGREHLSLVLYSALLGFRGRFDLPLNK